MSKQDAVMVRRSLMLLPLCLLLQDRPLSSAAGYNSIESQAVAVIPKRVDSKNQELLHYHPLLFLEMSLERYNREVTGYTTRFVKQERIGGQLNPPESLDVWFREQPFSVCMYWLDGPHEGQKAVYVAGENNGKLLARGAGALKYFGIFTKDIDDAEAKRNGRYTIDQFGIYLGTQRTVASMRKAQERGTLHLTYEGVYAVPQLGNRECYKFVRTPYDPLEEEGVNELTLFLDCENWLQVGSVLKDSQGQLIAEYYFRDLKLNPQFKKEQFTRAAL
jgi:hypothetical protein